ncbi:hypothetical protein [Rhodococcus sp. NPDC058521]|uniref:hypothetical protein n=1 Tax=Rhodococcus sp. NPDC058521 TaxID=3346536 RepID=UPI00365412EE
MKLRKFAVRAFSVAAVAVTACVGVGGAANAAPVDAPRYGPLGEFIHMVQLDGTCNGTVHVNMQTDQARPGKVRVVLTPNGLQGPKPSCDLEMGATPMVPRYDGSGVDGFGKEIVPVSFPRGSHEPVAFDVTAGSGLNMITVGPFNPYVGFHTGYYMIVP